VQDEALDPKTNEFLFSQLTVLLGGRVAERLFMGDISTGAVDDLQRATKNAMDQLLTYGMSKSIGHLSFQPNEKSDGRAWMNYSEDLHARVEQEARELVARAYDATVKGLEKDRASLEILAERLLKNKEIYRADMEEVLGPRPAAALLKAAEPKVAEKKA
jgi:AFG3 family protein